MDYTRHFTEDRGGFWSRSGVSPWHKGGPEAVRYGEAKRRDVKVGEEIYHATYVLYKKETVRFPRVDVR
jgi:hypothetical protein